MLIPPAMNNNGSLFSVNSDITVKNINDSNENIFTGLTVGCYFVLFIQFAHFVFATEHLYTQSSARQYKTSIHEADGCLIARSLEIPKPWDSAFDFSNRSDSWRAPG